ncbi:Uroporphyrin-III C/tetrapyrrole (Corrin/Porphyrin) methyltransferase [Desulfofarcimen acetoxidans DSM 771]|uniref:Ribosomal RNA small subunit methyltransferase I n=1 Tax=Desulfofarcimen acetoxidans (strain ATCC 49208 / DSM 771 / KCTC 5769 / VKM B-1644 / 5575) TaxID=485916 RepID=C8W2R1_DESAS|nr:16S rRNA (cytidine(1402)-2'-O)-methyltransferase [Desulfofarcimen acetoxidans]ACV61067.1 Uroporphyrin-III C/tetrapyrrole (Corrin/Porphyrin) methyltransferase [Desulfofarcimen acetoxidans DSM 771]
MSNNAGKLYLCATPIGNLEDITLRVLRVLKEVDLIAAEDTRHTRKLLSHYDIHIPLTSYHRHNIEEKSQFLLTKLLAGEHIALVSDAGMPGISDPGEEMVALAIENGIEVIPLPGASAVIAALVISGFSTRSFMFAGFLPASKKARRDRLIELKKQTETLVFYEAPHRITEMLQDVMHCLGDRRISLSRELTKKFEQTVRGTASEAINSLKTDRPRGEFTVVVEGAGESESGEVADLWGDMTIAEHVELFLLQGLDRKEALKRVAVLRGIPKKEVYSHYVQSKENLLR